MAPHKFVPPPDLNSKPASLDAVSLSMDEIVLSEDSFLKCVKLPSGTVRCTRKEPTPEEIATVKQEAHARRSDAWLTMGSSQTGDEIAPTSPLTPQEIK